MLVAGVDCDRFEELDLLESLGSSFELRRDRSRDGERDDRNETKEFRRSSDGIFCVSIAAGGFLLSLLAGLSSCRERLSSLSLCFLSLRRCFSTSSGQLGDKQISVVSDSTSVSILRGAG